PADGADRRRGAARRQRLGPGASGAVARPRLPGPGDAASRPRRAGGAAHLPRRSGGPAPPLATAIGSAGTGAPVPDALPERPGAGHSGDDGAAPARLRRGHDGEGGARSAPRHPRPDRRRPFRARGVHRRGPRRARSSGEGPVAPAGAAPGEPGRAGGGALRPHPPGPPLPSHTRPPGEGGIYAQPLRWARLKGRTASTIEVLPLPVGRGPGRGAWDQIRGAWDQIQWGPRGQVLALLLAFAFVLGCAGAGTHASATAGEAAGVSAPVGSNISASQQVLVTLKPAPPALWTRTTYELAQIYGLRTVAAWTMVSLGEQCVVFQIPRDRSREEILHRLSADPRVGLAQAIASFDTLAEGAPGGSYNDPYAHLQRSIQALDLEKAHRWATGKGVR